MWRHLLLLPFLAACGDEDPRYVPTLLGLERMLDGAEPDAVVEVERDDRGRISWLSIDHLPDAIDDEECYRVSGVTSGHAAR